MLFRSGEWAPFSNYLSKAGVSQDRKKLTQRRSIFEQNITLFQIGFSNTLTKFYIIINSPSQNSCHTQWYLLSSVMCNFLAEINVSQEPLGLPHETES